MKQSLFLLITFLISTLAYSQNISIQGKVIDKKSNEPLFGANALLLNPEDSTIIKGTSADLDGAFEINAAPGKYIIRISYFGYNDWFRNIELSSTPINLGVLALEEKVIALKDVTIVGKVSPTLQKGDTTQYNAGSFKTNPDANAEDLISKMPGVVIQNGKVQAQGEDVQRILVDGKPFFGEDPNAVLKNLPAEVIDKIQVFDRKSDQAQFTGIDDGNTIKTINIVTKPEFRNGRFGKVYSGFGTDERYKSGGNINMFDGDRRISIVGLTNNINEQNFSSDDLSGVMSASGGGGRGGRGGPGGGRPGGGNDAGSFLVNQRDGISITNSLGINYSDKFGKKLDFTGSYFFNKSSNIANSSIYRQYVLPSDSGLVYQENSNSGSDNINHRANFRISYAIDSSNSLLFQPRFSFQGNEGNSTFKGVNSQSTELVNTLNNLFTSQLNSYSLSAPVQYRHKFAKKGRTLAVSTNIGLNNSDGESYQNSQNESYNGFIATDSLNQFNQLDKKGLTVASEIDYTEPIGKKGIINFEYDNRYNRNSSEKETFQRSPLSQLYDIRDTFLTNIFTNVYIAHELGARYQLNQQKYNFSVGLNYQQANLSNKQTFPYQYDLNKNFTSILPNARFQYNFSSSRNIRIFYRARTNAPNVDQLQDVLNNSNPLQLRIGNPNLKQDYQQSLIARYSANNSEKSTTFFAFLMASINNNYIGNSLFIASQDTTLSQGITLNKGVQLSTPVNLNGYYALRSFITFGKPVAKLKSNLNFNISANYSRTPGLINDLYNYSNNTNVGLGLILSSNFSPNFDFTISSNTSGSKVSNSLQQQLNTTYLNQSSRIKVNWIFLKSFLIQSELTHQVFTGLSNSFNQNFLLWNAGVGYKFLKDKSAEVKLTAFDLLKQNKSIARNTSESYIEDTQTTVLQRFVMLNFTYTIKPVAKKKVKDE
ncbi:MAG TPA: outer membrane beta-barrel protein [Cytophagaceae bacterium]